jgi:hypothetical protein
VNSYKNHIRGNLLLIELFLLILVLSSCTYLKQRLNLGEFSLKSAIIWAKQDSTRVADSLNRIIAEKEIFKQTLTDSIMSLEGKSVSGSGGRASYKIVIGSFASTENAEDVADRYRSMGYKTSMIPGSNRNGDKIVMVSINSFDNADEARNYLNEFRRKVNSNAWLYTN